MKKISVAFIALVAVLSAMAAYAKPNPPFNLRINNEATGVPTYFHWTVPGQRVSGEPITAGDIAKYTLYWGTASRQYTSTMDFPVGQNQYEITGKWPGPTVYYFAVTSTDTAGRESEFSNELSLNKEGE